MVRYGVFVADFMPATICKASLVSETDYLATSVVFVNFSFTCLSGDVMVTHF